MSNRIKQHAKTADVILPQTLTQDFCDSLRAVLATDDSFKARYLDSVLLSKYLEPGAGHAEKRRSAAIAKWLKTETTNERTNARLLNWGESRSVHVLPGVTVNRFLDKVRSIIADVLPWTPSLDLLYCRFSGGASTSKSRRDSHPAVKFLDKADVTRQAYPLFRSLTDGTRWASHLSEAGLEPRLVAGNVMFTVPKNSDIDRVACKEPDLNMFLQRGLGIQIGMCLRKVGIDLHDQSKNRKLASLGARTGSLMTLDLSSASDSVCTELVRRVMPSDWFYYLNLVRSPVTEIDGTTHTNEMFSSMGNGFTFELESLLFYAITRATAYMMRVRGPVSVYGDDIIAPSELFDALSSTLAFCGFEVNPKKSFAEGPFRESCGGHYYGDEDVTPFYVWRPLSTLSELILRLNQLVRWASWGGVMDPRYEDVWRKFASHVPEELWGGSDLSSRTSLVSGDAPRCELHYPSKAKPILHVGGLLLWLFSGLDEARKGCLQVTSSSTPSFARIRRRQRFETVRHTVYTNGSPKVITVRSDRELPVHDVPAFLGRYGRPEDMA